MAEVILLKSFRAYKWRGEALEKVKTAVNYFPELDEEVIYLGITKRKDCSADVDVLNRIIRFQIETKPTFVTVFHELAHIVIYKLSESGKDVPRRSEEFCSIFAMARMPPELIDEDAVPYVGKYKVPREYVPKICKKALEYRKTHRNYIQQCKEWLGCSVRQWMTGRLDGIWVETAENKRG